MRNDVPKWSGIAAVSYACFILLQSFLQQLSGVNVFRDDAPDFLTMLAHHRLIFTLSAVAGALGLGCAIALVAGLFVVLRRNDEYLSMLAVGLSFLGLALLAVALVEYGNLVGTAAEFTQGGLAPANVIAQQGDVQGDQFEITYFLGQVVLGLGLTSWALLLMRSGEYKPLLSVVTAAVVLFSPLLYVLPVPFMIARVAWLLTVAWIMVNQPSRQPLNEFTPLLEPDR